MLQIIGWLGCFMVAIKLLEMAGNPALRDDKKEMVPPVMIAVFVGWIGVLGFALWLFFQGASLSDQSSSLFEQSGLSAETARRAECLRDKTTTEEMMTCY